MNTKSAAKGSAGGHRVPRRGGVWIDHHKAIIVELTDDAPKIAEIASHVEKHLERAGDEPMQGRAEPLMVPADDRRQRMLTGDLNRYYDSVIAAVGDFSRLLILGPGEAKGELHARLVNHKLGDRVAAIETVDKMSEPQLAAKVRSHFGVEAPRTAPR